MDDDFLIECVENETENGYYDFKKDIYDFKEQKCKEDFLTDILSFANSHSKGDKYIITGVKLYEDNTRDIDGITTSKIIDGADYQSLVNDNVEPNIIIDFKVLEHNDNKFGIFRICKKNTDQPYMLSKQYGKLPKGFIKIRKGQKNEFVTRRDFDLFYKEKTSKEVSNIHIKGLIDKKVSNEFKIVNHKAKIDYATIKSKINDMYLHIRKMVIIKSAAGFSWGNPLYVNEETKKIISDYAEKNSIELRDDFFDIGNITYHTLPYQATRFYGSDTEKKKYNLICELERTIERFDGLNKFYDITDNILCTDLVIENSGKKYDEDIEVILKVKKDKLLKFDDFPIPSRAIFEHIINEKVLNKYLEVERINGINTYNGKYNTSAPMLPPIIESLGMDYSNIDYDTYVDYQKDFINSIADYEIISDDDYYYIKYEQKDIKPNEVISLPSRILFLDEPEFIEYEIKTKHNPNTQYGKISILKDN